MKKKSKKASSASGRRSNNGALGALVELKQAVSRVAQRVSQRAAERERNEPVSAVRLLKKQHREVRMLFERIEGARTHDAKRSLFDQLAANLVAHDAIEREIFYPACEAKLGLTKTLGEAIVEHGLVEFALYQADGARGREEFAFKVVVLREVVLHHVKEEESEFFPEVEAAFGDDELVELGGRMRARFEQALTGNFRVPLRQNLARVMRGVLKPNKAERKPKQRTAAASERAPKSSARQRTSQRRRAA
jgi:hemerythrin superfamily protein